MFRVLKKLCCHSQEIRDYLSEMPSIGLEVATNAIRKPSKELAGPTRVFIGHFLSFMANLVTAAPSSSDLPSNTLNHLLESKDVVEYVVGRAW